MQTNYFTCVALLWGVALLTGSCGGDSPPNPQPGPEALSPVVVSFVPTSVVAGEELTLTGSNFSATTTANTVTLNQIPVTVLEASSTRLVVRLPDNAACSGPVQVTVAGKSGMAPGTLTFVPATVYIAGYELPTGGVQRAVLWRNGVKTTLAGGTGNSIAYSVYVSGGTVYVAGSESVGSSPVAVLWTDGVKAILSEGSAYAVATSVVVSGGDVYVSGYEKIGEVNTAVLWKNGEKTLLGDGVAVSLAYAVAVSEAGVYVAGSEYTDDHQEAAVWKDGTRNFLEQIPDYVGNSVARSIALADNGDRYVAGNIANVGLLWQNGTKIPLPASAGATGSVANSVAVSGTDVYVAGHVLSGLDLSMATLWKNGALTPLGIAGSKSYARSVCVSGGDVYVAGYENRGSMAAVMWRNGVKTTLSDQSWTQSVFVVPAP